MGLKNCSFTGDHGPAMVLTKKALKAGRFLQHPAAIFSSSAPKQRHQKGAGWHLPCCEIAPNFAPIVPGLTPSVEETTGELSIYQSKNGV